VSNHELPLNLRLFLVSFSGLVCLLLFSGCSLLRASAAKDAGFVPYPEKLSERRERAPFHGYWVMEPEDYDKRRLNGARFVIAPIDIKILERSIKDRYPRGRTAVDRIEEAAELARYFEERLRLEFVAIGHEPVAPDATELADAFVLRLALVDVQPTEPGVQLLGTAAGFVVPGGGIIKLAGQGSIAVEGFVEHSMEPGSTTVWEQFKDREGQKYSAFSIKDYQRYAHLAAALDDWAKQFAELLSTDKSHRVVESDLVRLNPL
jgi:hypothetical protein